MQRCNVLTTAEHLRGAAGGSGRYAAMNDTMAFDIFTPPLQTSCTDRGCVRACAPGCSRVCARACV